MLPANSVEPRPINYDVYLKGTSLGSGVRDVVGGTLYFDLFDCLFNLAAMANAILRRLQCKPPRREHHAVFYSHKIHFFCERGCALSKNI